jgi:hypothetical protein
MTDGVDAAVDSVQPPAPRPLTSRTRTPAQGHQLKERNHTMLAPGQAGNRPVDGVAVFSSAILTKTHPPPERAKGLVTGPDASATGALRS